MPRNNFQSVEGSSANLGGVSSPFSLYFIHAFFFLQRSAPHHCSLAHFIKHPMGSEIRHAGDATTDRFRIFIGYDPREDAAYQVCRRSLLRRSSIPLEIHPIRQSDLRAASLYWRDRGPTESTEFSFTRFLTPFLADFRGWGLFVDCDFLFLADAADLFALRDNRFAVMCVHHEYAPVEPTKMDGAIQTVYPRKNWSSLVLYNCGHPKNVAALTPEAVSTQTGAFLHRFMWLDDAEIGEIPFVWNFLVGHNKVDPADPEHTSPKAIHYTCGGPWFERYKNCEFADLWNKELEELNAEKQAEDKE